MQHIISQAWIQTYDFPNVVGQSKACGRCSGLMVRMLVSRSSGLGIRILAGDIALEFLGKTLYSHSTRLHPGVSGYEG